uniref:Uncharacterized protein n=2 Tax=Amphimedon queenslandica TaxID=400682 RepID=A0A1X7VG08_AMPQE
MRGNEGGALTGGGAGICRIRIRMAVSVSFEGQVAVLRMERGENRFNIEFLDQFLSALDKVEGNPNTRALVTTGDGKFYSNGLDLEAMSTYNEEQFKEFDRTYQLAHKRLLTFPMVTIAAINGHAYAAGGILALAHDIRIMRKERGWFCLPEIKINRSFTISTMELVKAKLPQSEQVASVLMGRRYTGQEALDAGIIQGVMPGPQLLLSALKRGEEAAKENFDRSTLGELKNALYFSTVKALTEPNTYYSKL